MLSAINQTQRDNYCTIPLIRRTSNSQIHRDRKPTSEYQGLGGGEGDLLFNGHSISVREDDKVLEMDIYDGCTTV